MKLIAALLAVCLLIASPAFAIVDLGDPRVTRIWRPTDEGDRFTCSATWIRPGSGSTSWLLTAGHCATDAKYVKRGVNDGVSTVINWKAVITSHAQSGKLIDLAIATAPDLRDDRKYHSFIADKFPASAGTKLYIHGFPNGVERVTPAIVVGLSDLDRTSMEVKVEPGSILPGSSGSVVLDSNSFVVGVVWGLHVTDPTRVFVTPIEYFHALVKLIDAKIQGEE